MGNESIGKIEQLFIKFISFITKLEIKALTKTAVVKEVAKIAVAQADFEVTDPATAKKRIKLGPA